MAFGQKKAPHVEERSAKTIEFNAEMHGSLSFKDPVDLRVNGVFFGALDVRGTLSIGVKANVEANINGDNVVIAGKVKGNVSATRMLTLLPTAVLYGDIHAPKLNIVEGAIFQGACQMPVLDGGGWMNLAELASYLELDESSILSLVREGKIPVVCEGDVLRFERSQIDAWAVSGMVQ